MTVLAENERVRSMGWIALYTKADQEKIAIANIQRQGFDAYCPMIERMRRHARRTEKVLRPLFPSYVFVLLDERKSQWRTLLSTVGVRSVIRFNDRLGFMPEGLVEELRECEEHDILRQKTTPMVRPGMEVKMLDGPFQNMIAKVLSLPEKDRVWLLLNIVGREVRVQHDVWSVTSQ